MLNYFVKPAELTLHIETTNKISSVLGALSYDALALRFPERPPQYDGVIPILGTNIGMPTILPMSFGKSALLLCNDDVRRPLLIGFPWALDRLANRAFPLRINTGRDSMYPDSLPSIERAIPPGATDHFTLSRRFGPAPSNIPHVAGDILGLFSRLNPFTLNWPDRRPIGSLIIATAATGWSRNPRGWLLDRGLDVTTKSGIALFHAKLLAWADRSVAILKKMDAQGMVTWDIEGEQFPHPTTYIGDPRLAERLAPEMQGVLDEYFRRFTKAGLRVGITIRPQTVVISGAGNALQKASPDPAQTLLDKIEYAKKRWGATLFYIDSNGDPALPLSFEVIRRVSQRFPDVLLMPEHKNVVYYSKTAPYTELRGGFASTPAIVSDVYQHAFSVINTADGRLDQESSELQKAVSRGDILMFRAWYDDPANPKVKAIYLKGQRAGRAEASTKPGTPTPAAR